MVNSPNPVTLSLLSNLRLQAAKPIAVPTMCPKTNDISREAPVWLWLIMLIVRLVMLAISRIKDKLTKTTRSNVAVSVLASAVVFSKDSHVCFCSVESCMRDKRQ